MSVTPQMHGRYALSFTSGTLLSREATITVPLYLNLRDWSEVRRRLTEDNLLQTRTASSEARLSREIVQRLAVFTDAELEFLHEVSSSERVHLMWIAACRRYTLIGEFAEEIVRERFLLLTPSLGYNDFDSFVRAKALWHPELLEIKDSTLQKLRANLFRMLTEAGLIQDGEIVNALPSERVREVLEAKIPSDLRFLPTRISQERSL